MLPIGASMEGMMSDLEKLTIILLGMTFALWVPIMVHAAVIVGRLDAILAVLKKEDGE